MDSLRRLSRRSLLGFLAGSPLWLAAKPAPALEWMLAQLAHADAGGDGEPLIRSPEAALSVFDFEPVARDRLSAAHWTYLSMGVHDEFTLKANRAAFGDVRIRPQRLVDVRDVDPSTEILGTAMPWPIVLAPCGAQRAFHPEGEVAVARAARSGDHLQILSTGSSAGIEDVVAAREAPIWHQLYTPNVWPATRWQLGEAEEAGCPAVVLTVDVYPGLQANRDRIRAFRRADNPDCQSCHAGVSRLERAIRAVDRLGDSVGIDVGGVLTDFGVLDWDYVDRIRDGTDMKLLIKGILTPEDAERCVEHGADGIVVSNHGGRAEDSGLATITALPGIASAVAGRVPILVDSGFRRGPDIFKALALGASAVCVGRPYLWGLAAFGQEGVEAVLALLRAELGTIMKQTGTVDLAALSSDRVEVVRCRHAE